MTLSKAAVLAAAAVSMLGACRAPAPEPVAAPIAAPAAAQWAGFDLPRLSETADLNADRSRVMSCVSAAAGAAVQPAMCIGVVADACMDSDQEKSTASTVSCIDRENAAWEALLGETEEKLALKSNEMKEAVVKSHKAFFADREAQCLLPYVIKDGGAKAHAFSAGCANEMTAHQVLRLRQQAQSLDPS